MKNILDYLEEGVKNELNVSYLYAAFYYACPEDYQFWWDLSMEEVNHASLLRSGMDFCKFGDSPFEVSDKDLQELIELNIQLPCIIEEFKKNPSRKKAFEIALELENSVGEIHYQKVMTSDKNDQLIKIFKKLNKDDMDHETRIRRYMRENDI